MSESTNVVAFAEHPRRAAAAPSRELPVPGPAPRWSADKPARAERQGREARPRSKAAPGGRRNEPRLERTLWARVEARLAAGDEAQAREREAAGPLLAELWALAAAERLSAVEEVPRFWTLALTDRLLDLALRPPSAPASPDLEARREEAAALALALARRLDAARYGRSAVAERQSMAWCCRAECRRRQGDLAGAERDFRGARESFAAEPAEGRERAYYAWLRARLCRDRGEMDEALALLARAAQGFAAWKAPVEAGEARAEHGWLCLELEALTDAEESFQAASAGLHGTPATAARVRTELGLGLCLAELGYARDAARMLAQARSLAETLPSLDRLRSLTLEARLAERLGKAAVAEVRYRRAVAGLLAEVAFAEAAVAVVELAALHAAQGRVERIARLRQRAAPLLAPGALPEDSQAVVLLALGFAERQDWDGTELLAEAAEHLARVLDSPAVVFRPGRLEQTGWRTFELGWDGLGRRLRRRLCEEAGLPVALAGAEVPPVERRLLSWTHEELVATRILFAPPAAEGATARGGEER